MIFSALAYALNGLAQPTVTGKGVSTSRSTEVVAALATTYGVQNITVTRLAEAVEQAGSYEPLQVTERALRAYKALLTRNSTSVAPEVLAQLPEAARSQAAEALTWDAYVVEQGLNSAASLLLTSEPWGNFRTHEGYKLSLAQEKQSAKSVSEIADAQLARNVKVGQMGNSLDLLMKFDERERRPELREMLESVDLAYELNPAVAAATLIRYKEQANLPPEGAARLEFTTALALDLSLKPQEALPHYERAFELEPINPEYAVTLAVALLMFGHEEQDKRAEQILQKFFRKNPDSRRYDRYFVEAGIGLALTWQSKGERRAATKLNRQMVRLLHRTIGLNNEQGATLFNNMAAANIQRNPRRARRWARASLRIAEHLPESKNHHVCRALTNIGLQYRIEGKYEAALNCWNQVLALYEARFGGSNPYAITTLVNLAAMSLELRHYSQALSYYQQAYNAQAGFYGADTPYAKQLAQSVEVVQKKLAKK